MSKWKGLVRGAAAVFAAVILAGIGGSALVKAADALPSQVEIAVPDNKVPTYQYQKSQDFVLQVTNKGEKAVTNLEIGPDLQGDDNSKWPFKTDYQKYSAKIERLEAGESQQVKFSFTERDDVSNARYTIHFTYTYKTEDGSGNESEVSGSNSFYVNTTAKPEEVKQDKAPKDKKDKKDKKKKTPTASDEVSAGGFSNSEPMYSDGGDGGGSSDGSVPRVIVTGFSTNPEKVKAGSDFTLTIHLKNTSKKSRVRNMLFDLNSPEEGADEQTTAPAFLPSSGSSSIYLEGMKANGTADISIKLNAKSDLLQKPYSVELSMKYEDANYNAVEAASSLSIPVKQDARFEFSDFEINPESIAVEDEANVMCNLYNLGRIKLYNVKAVFEGDCIEKEEVFVGNVESGATASIDAMLKGTQPSEGPQPVKMTMSYENEEGEVSTEEKELMLEVTEVMEDDMSADMPIEEEKSGGIPIIPIVAVIAVLAIAAIVIILRKRKKKMRLGEEEEFLDELDGSSEDEQQ